MEQKASAVGTIVGNLIGIVLLLSVAMIFDINSLKEYGWFVGSLHGVWAPGNWILSWFNDSVIMKAPIHTNAYNIWWWTGLLCGIWIWIKSILAIIASIRVLTYDR